MPTSVHLPEPLLEAVDRKARSLRISRNQLVVRALEREVSESSNWSPGFFDQLAERDPEISKTVDDLVRNIPKRPALESSETILKYLLDTNAVSALMKGEPLVIQRLRAVNRTDVAIPQPVIAEIAYGIARLPGSKRREMLQKRFDAIRVELGRASWTDIVSERFGTIKAALEKRGKRIEDFDAAIAAHALVGDAILVAANLDQMTRVPGLRVEDWSAAR